MPLAAGTVIEHVASWLDGPELAECVFHHEVDIPGSGTTEEQLQAIANELEGLLETLTDTCMCASTAFVGMQQRVLPGWEGNGFIRSLFSTQVGGVTGQPAGAQECALVSKYTIQISRAGRGRMYLPFVPEEFIWSGRITTDGKSAYEAAIAPILSAKLEYSGGGECYAGVWSRSDSAFYRMAFTQLRSVTTTQRRRVKRKQPFSTT